MQEVVSILFGVFCGLWTYAIISPLAALFDTRESRQRFESFHMGIALLVTFLASFLFTKLY
jgi:hypothetical protein